MITAYFDGGSRGNPGPAGWGAYIINDDGTVLAELSGALGVEIGRASCRERV